MNERAKRPPQLRVDNLQVPHASECGDFDYKLEQVEEEEQVVAAQQTSKVTTGTENTNS